MLHFPSVIIKSDGPRGVNTILKSENQFADFLGIDYNTRVGVLYAEPILLTP